MATKSITLLDVQLGYGISAEQRAEIHRRITPIYARILRRLLAEGEQPSKPTAPKRRQKR